MKKIALILVFFISFPLIKSTQERTSTKQNFQVLKNGEYFIKVKAVPLYSLPVVERKAIPGKIKKEILSIEEKALEQLDSTELEVNEGIKSSGIKTVEEIFVDQIKTLKVESVIEIADIRKSSIKKLESFEDEITIDDRILREIESLISDMRSKIDQTNEKFISNLQKAIEERRIAIRMHINETTAFWIEGDELNLDRSNIEKINPNFDQAAPLPEVERRDIAEVLRKDIMSVEEKTLELLDTAEIEVIELIKLSGIRDIENKFIEQIRTLKIKSATEIADIRKGSIKTLKTFEENKTIDERTKREIAFLILDMRSEIEQDIGELLYNVQQASNVDISNVRKMNPLFRTASKGEIRKKIENLWLKQDFELNFLPANSLNLTSFPSFWIDFCLFGNKEKQNNLVFYFNIDSDGDEIADLLAVTEENNLNRDSFLDIQFGKDGYSFPFKLRNKRYLIERELGLKAEDDWYYNCVRASFSHEYNQNRSIIEIEHTGEDYSEVILRRRFSKLDLQKYPLLSLDYEALEGYIPWVYFGLKIDTNGNGRPNKLIYSPKRNHSSGELIFDAYNAVKKNFPKKKNSFLLEIYIFIGDDPFEKSSIKRSVIHLKKFSSFKYIPPTFLNSNGEEKEKKIIHIIPQEAAKKDESGECSSMEIDLLSSITQDSSFDLANYYILNGKIFIKNKKQQDITSDLRLLIKEAYFSQPRNFADLVESLEKRAKKEIGLEEIENILYEIKDFGRKSIEKIISTNEKIQIGIKANNLTEFEKQRANMEKERLRTELISAEDKAFINLDKIESEIIKEIKTVGLKSNDKKIENLWLTQGYKLDFLPSEPIKLISFPSFWMDFFIFDKKGKENNLAFNFNIDSDGDEIADLLAVTQENDLKKDSFLDIQFGKDGYSFPFKLTNKRYLIERELGLKAEDDWYYNCVSTSFTQEYNPNNSIIEVEYKGEGYSEVILRRRFSKLDLQKYPFLSLDYEVLEGYIPWVHFGLKIDTTGNGRPNTIILSPKRNDATGELFFNAYNAVKKNFPEKEDFFLVEIFIHIAKEVFDDSIFNYSNICFKKFSSYKYIAPSFINSHGNEEEKEIIHIIPQKAEKKDESGEYYSLEIDLLSPINQDNSFNLANYNILNGKVFIKDKKQKDTTDDLRLLIKEAYFSQPRDLEDIPNILLKMAYLTSKYSSIKYTFGKIQALADERGYTREQIMAFGRNEMEKAALEKKAIPNFLLKMAYPTSKYSSIIDTLSERKLFFQDIGYKKQIRLSEFKAENSVFKFQKQISLDLNKFNIFKIDAKKIPNGGEIICKFLVNVEGEKQEISFVVDNTKEYDLEKYFPKKKAILSEVILLLKPKGRISNLELEFQLKSLSFYSYKQGNLLNYLKNTYVSGFQSKNSIPTTYGEIENFETTIFNEMLSLPLVELDGKEYSLGKWEDFDENKLIQALTNGDFLILGRTHLQKGKHELIILKHPWLNAEIVEIVEPNINKN